MRIRLAIALLCLVQFCFAADRFWEAKPWQQWNDDEVNRVLRNSPWAVSVPVQQGNASGTGAHSAAAAMVNPAADPTVSYLVQLQSAPTLRRAMARRLQIDYGYDDGKRSDSLDAQLAAFLKKQFPDTVVVSVTFTSKAEESLNQARSYWDAQTNDSLKSATRLEVNGRRYPLTMFQVTAPREFLLVFARPKALARNGVAVIEFPAPPNGATARSKTVHAEFNLNDLVVNGEPEM